MPHSGRDIVWSEALGLLARTDHTGREIFRLTGSGWEPPVDVLETELGLLVVVALPGVRADEMEIVIADGVLMVRGTRRWPPLDGPARAHRIELPHGRFERRLPLPHGTYQLAARDHADGCLTLTLRRLG
ncbi:MAG: Hsp20/alpha crystallin family protein [Janthinobacterium lividum]